MKRTRTAFEGPTVSLDSTSKTRKGSHQSVTASEKEKEIDKKLKSNIRKHPQKVLSEEQQRALDLAISGQNVFITGPGGTGKSFLIDRIVDELSRRRGYIVDVVATTGIAAIKVKGQTLHAWAGVGLAQKSAEQLCSDLKRQPWLAKAKKRWLKVQTLIVDEVSMLDPEFFEKLDHIGRNLRLDRVHPFGGIQIIFCGDFFQLPPVIKRDTTTDNTPRLILPVTTTTNPSLFPNATTIQSDVTKIERKYCFESDLWHQMFPLDRVVQLRHLFRQNDDSTFQKMLNEIRFGVPSQETIERLMTRVGRPRDQRLIELGIEPTRLYPLNEQVDQLNKTRLVELKTEEQHYQSFVLHYGSYLDRNPELYQKTVEKIKTGCIAGDMVSLKVGAQVMLLKNIADLGLVNGSRGIVIDFKNSSEMDDVEIESSSSSEEEEDDKERVKEEEETLSHVEKLLKTKSNKSAYQEQKKNKRFPVVRFLNGVELTLSFQHWSVHSPESDESADYWEMFFFQIPLKLAWACSIHKAQGMELDCASIKMRGMFEEGQAYVAFSRIHDLNSLYLEDFETSSIRANKTVVEYYKQLER